MNSGARLGLAVAAGYALGRFHKMKWALAVAALARRGRLGGAAGGLFQQGAKVLSSSPEFTQLTEEMKGRLVEAGKAAALAVVSGKINALSDGLRDRTDAMRAGGADGEGSAAGMPERDEGERQRDERAGQRDERAGQRDEGERQRDEDRRPAASSSRRRPAERDGDRVPAPRRPASRAESDGAPASRQSRSAEEKAAHARAGQPSQRDGDRDDAGSERQGGGGRSRPPSAPSRSGGDSE